MYLNPDKNHCYGILGFSIIYNHYLGPRNIDNMADVADNKLAQCTYTGKRGTGSLKNVLP